MFNSRGAVRGHAATCPGRPSAGRTTGTTTRRHDENLLEFLRRDLALAAPRFARQQGVRIWRITSRWPDSLACDPPDPYVLLPREARRRQRQIPLQKLEKVFVASSRRRLVVQSAEGRPACAPVAR
jgi:hypothetical protein